MLTAITAAPQVAGLAAYLMSLYAHKLDTDWKGKVAENIKKKIVALGYKRNVYRMKPTEQTKVAYNGWGEDPRNIVCYAPAAGLGGSSSTGLAGQSTPKALARPSTPTVLAGRDVGTSGATCGPEIMLESGDYEAILNKFLSTMSKAPKPTTSQATRTKTHSSQLFQGTTKSVQGATSKAVTTTKTSQTSPKRSSTKTSSSTKKVEVSSTKPKATTTNMVKTSSTKAQATKTTSKAKESVSITFDGPPNCRPSKPSMYRGQAIGFIKSFCSDSGFILSENSKPRKEIYPVDPISGIPDHLLTVMVTWKGSKASPKCAGKRYSNSKDSKMCFAALTKTIDECGSKGTSDLVYGGSVTAK